MSWSERKLVENVKMGKVQFHGHILRACGWERVCLLGRIVERRAEGRQIMKYINSFILWGRQDVQPVGFSLNFN